MRRYLWVLLVCSFVPFTHADTEDTVVFRGRMLPANEVPALDIPGASADYTFGVRATRDNRGVITAATVVFQADYTMPSQVTFTGFHIHNGPAGTNAGVVIDSGLSGSNSVTGTTGRIVRVVNVPDNRLNFVTGVLANPTLYYINLHTTVYGGGIVRDQLKPNSLSFRPALLPANEVPALTTDAAGAGLLRIDVVRDITGKITSGAVTFDIDYRFPSSVRLNGLHIHKAAAGVNGAIVIDSGLSSANGVTNTSGRGNIFRVADITTSAGIATLEQIFSDPSQFYVNLHNDDFPGGAMRGQLETDTINFLSRMEGAQENPPVITTGYADALSTVKVTRDGTGNITNGTVTWNISYNFPGAITFTGLHYHNARIGINGPVVLGSDLSGTNSVPSTTGVGSFSRTATFAPNSTGVPFLTGVFADPEGYYVNIHSTVNGGGVVRDQLAKETYRFKPTMRSTNEIPSIDSQATGNAWLTVKVYRDANRVITGGAVTFDVNYDLGGAATITGLHFHRGTAVQNGPVVIDSGLSSSNSVVTTTGSGNITRTADITSTNTTGLDALNDLVRNPNGLYVNLHTTVNPGGFVRSQLLPLVSQVPHVAGGGDWVTAVRITNLSGSASAQGEMITRDTQGNFIADAIIDPTLNFWLPPEGSVTLATSNAGALTGGTARVLTNGAVSVDVAYYMPGLTTDGLVKPVTANSISVPVSVGASGVRNTGIAILSLEDVPTTLLLTLKDASGAGVSGATRAISLGAGAKISQYVTEMLGSAFPTGAFTGTLQIEMTRGPFPSGLMSVVSLQFDTGTVTPVTIRVVN
jgi:hypothetical protein